MKKHVLPTLLLLFTLAGCSRNLAGEEESRVAYTPIYGDKANYSEVKSEPAKAIRNGGKIVLYGNILFQVETGEGIHVFDISNPENTKRLGYIKSYMCNELAVNDGFILTNNMDDLVIINIADPGNIKVVNRMDGEFPEMAQSVPPERGVYFECPDLQKGVIIGWTKTTSTNAKCKLN